MLGPIVGGYFVFGGDDITKAANANAGLYIPYLGIAIFVSILLVVFIFSKVPDLRTEDETRKSAELKISLKPSGGQLAGIAVALALVCWLLYFFIAPILQLVWTLLNLNQELFQPVKYGLLVVAFLASSFWLQKTGTCFRRKHFYAGASPRNFFTSRPRRAIFSFFVNYVLENDPGVTKMQASTWLGAFGFGLFHVRTPVRQRRDQPDETASRAGDLRRHQRSAVPP